MIYYDFYPYKHWTFLLKASHIGLQTLELYDNQNLAQEVLDKSVMRPYIDYLDAYFNHLPLPQIKLDLIGTLFQQSIWHYLQTIPHGKTASYKDVAVGIHSPKAYQAVGTAIGKNPVMIVVPCHRVIKNSGTIGGFSSDPLLKIELIHLENKGTVKK